jgi:3-hydroxyisobutyrate dehydrogenase
MERKIGVIGVGAMGSGVATRLLGCGHQVMVYDLNPDRVRMMENKGAESVKLLRDMANADVVISSLTNPAAVAQVFLGDSDILTCMTSGSLVIELSTIDAKTMKEVSDRAGHYGISALDCPVSGSPKEASEGRLTLLVAGEQSIISASMDLLGQIGKDVTVVGPLAGMAKTVKLVNNTMTMGNILIAAEAFVMGVKAGIQPDVLFKVLSTSGGRSHQFLKRFPSVVKRDFEPGFPVDLGEKDLRLALSMAHDVGAALPVTGAIQQMYRACSLDGNGGEDIIAIVKIFERWAGLD